MSEFEGKTYKPLPKDDYEEKIKRWKEETNDALYESGANQQVYSTNWVGFLTLFFVIAMTIAFAVAFLMFAYKYEPTQVFTSMNITNLIKPLLNTTNINNIDVKSPIVNVFNNFTIVNHVGNLS